MLPADRTPLGLARRGIGHLARVLVSTVERQFGVLIVGLEGRGELSNRDHFVLTTLSNQAATALEGARLRDESQALAERLTIFNRLVRAITSSLDLEGVFNLLSSEVKPLIPHDRASVALADRDRQTATVYAATGQADTLARGTVVPIDGSMVGQVIQTGQGYFRKDLEQEDFVETPGLLAMGIRSNLTVPLWDGDICFGSLNLGSFEVGRYGTDELVLANEITRQVSVAIMNARRHEDVRSLSVLEERNRIAREIHDSVAQGLTGIIWQLNKAERLVEGGGAQASAQLGRIRDLARECLHDARRAVWDLRSEPLSTLSLADAVRSEMDKVTSNGSIQTSLVVSGEERTVSPGVEAAILRICQESLVNIVKHAGATEVSGALVFDESWIRLTIRDNGAGFDPEAPTSRERGTGGFGMIIMRERAHLLDGELKVESAPGQGTVVEATLPLG